MVGATISHGRLVTGVLEQNLAEIRAELHSDARVLIVQRRSTGVAALQRLKWKAAGSSRNLLFLLIIGGPCRDRTYDQLIKSQLLYQLS
jgi:hypothetical protein